MTTATLRPNGTITGSPTIVPSGTAHGVTSDDSDSTYFTTTGTEFFYDFVSLNLTTTTLPTGSMVKAMRFKWRGRSDSAATAAGRLRATLSGTTTIADWDGPIFTTTLGDITSGYYTLDDLSQSYVDGLVLDVFVDDPTKAMRAYELYVDLVYVEQPVVTATAITPDPYTAATYVWFGWTPDLDAAGGAQTNWQVKVFDQTTWGAGFTGLDPDTDTPYWTNTLASGTPYTYLGPLENSDTYRAYVRIAQTVNGVTFWSDWDYDEFTLSVTTADVDALEVTADPAGLIEVSVDIDVGGHAWEYIEVQRSTDAKATWQNVRGATFVDAVSSDNPFISNASSSNFAVNDYEVPNGTSAWYRARATWYSSGLPITGSWVESTAAVSWTSTDMWLKSVTDPTLNTTWRRRKTGHTRLRSRRAGVFDVVGSAYRVVVTDVRSATSGKLQAVTYTAAEETDMNALLDGSDVVLIQWPASYGLDDLYAVIVTDEQTAVVERAGDPYRFWTFDYVEVDIPGDEWAGSLL